MKARDTVPTAEAGTAGTDFTSSTSAFAYVRGWPCFFLRGIT